jgi:serine/threonine-protein kinase
MSTHARSSPPREEPTTLDAPKKSPRPAPLTPRFYAPGDVVAGKYELLSLLGEGGMGAVWRARNRTLDLEVALKLIRRELASSETSRRLLKEARAVARLEHPCIVRVYDFGETERGEPFMVMEVLRGDLLAEVLERKGRLAASNAVTTMLPVAAALVAAHERDIVHRDLKPENVLIVPGEAGAMRPVLMDFGIAILRGDGPSGGRITEERTLVGTPDYMSPEQACADGEIDARTDIWSFCVLLYELITGVRPFVGATPRQLFVAIQTVVPLPLMEHGVADERLWRILERGLAKDPAERWPSMRQLGVELARWALDAGVENDICGGGLAQHWMGGAMRRPLSEVPALTGKPVTVELSAERQSFSELRHASVDAPPPRSQRRALAIAAALGGAAVLAVVAFYAMREPQSATAEPSVAVPSNAPPAPSIATTVDPASAAPEAPPAQAPTPGASPPAVDASARRAPGTAPPLRRPAGSRAAPSSGHFPVPPKPNF